MQLLGTATIFRSTVESNHNSVKTRKYPLNIAPHKAGLFCHDLADALTFRALNPLIILLYGVTV